MGPWELVGLRGPTSKRRTPRFTNDSLGIQPGQIVADIGAGSGYFTRRLSAKVEREGRVMAVDIQPEMLAILRRSLTAAGISNVTKILGKKLLQISLPFSRSSAHGRCVMNFPSSGDDIGNYSALKPGGQVVWVEYRLEDPTVPIKLLHKMSRQQF